MATAACDRKRSTSSASKRPQAAGMARRDLEHAEQAVAADERRTEHRSPRASALARADRVVVEQLGESATACPSTRARRRRRPIEAVNLRRLERAPDVVVQRQRSPIRWLLALVQAICSATSAKHRRRRSRGSAAPRNGRSG